MSGRPHIKDYRICRKFTRNPQTEKNNPSL
jgi:hypothetical protein